MEIYSYTHSLIKGLLIGFSLAVPVGPIAILCMRRTLTKGKLSGVFSGLGAASADALYGLIAGFGVSLVYNFLEKHSVGLQIFGGIFLCYMGIRIFRSVPTVKANYSDEIGLAKDYISAFVMTMTNPMTLFAFAAVFAAAGVGRSNSTFVHTFLLVSGVAVGSALWWLLLTLIMSIFHGKIRPSGLKMINKIAGTGIALFGIVVLINGIQKFASPYL